MAFNQPQEIAEIRVPPLGAIKVKNFINTQVAKRQLSGEHAKSFLEKIYGLQGTIERKALAANPYALTMLLDLFTDCQYPFPQTREQHYDIYIEKAYKDNQKEKRGKTRIRTSFRRWKLALQQLAYAMMMEMKGTSVNSDWGARHIAPSRKWIYRRLGLAEFFEDELQSRLKHFATIEIKKLTYKEAKWIR